MSIPDDQSPETIQRLTVMLELISAYSKEVDAATDNPFLAALPSKADREEMEMAIDFLRRARASETPMVSVDDLVRPFDKVFVAASISLQGKSINEIMTRERRGENIERDLVELENILTPHDLPYVAALIRNRQAIALIKRSAASRPDIVHAVHLGRQAGLAEARMKMASSGADIKAARSKIADKQRLDASRRKRAQKRHADAFAHFQSKNVEQSLYLDLYTDEGDGVGELDAPKLPSGMPYARESLRKVLNQQAKKRKSGGT